MVTVVDMLRRFEAFNPVESAGVAIVENKKDILDINREQLYEKGIGNDGKPLPAYSKQYGRIKERQRGKSIVDIYRRGDLQREMELYVEGNDVIITSMSEHTPYVAHQRPTIFGLTTDGKVKAWHIIRPDFVERLRGETGVW